MCIDKVVLGDGLSFGGFIVGDVVAMDPLSVGKHDEGFGEVFRPSLCIDTAFVDGL